MPLDLRSTFWEESHLSYILPQIRNQNLLSKWLVHSERLLTWKSLQEMHDDLKKQFGMSHRRWTRNGREGSKQKAKKIRALQVALVVKNPPVHAGDARDAGWIPGSGRSPGEGNGYSLQYFCLENLMDRGAQQGIVHGVAKSQTWLNTALQGERNQERKVGWFTHKHRLSHTRVHTHTQTHTHTNILSPWQWFSTWTTC